MSPSLSARGIDFLKNAAVYRIKNFPLPGGNGKNQGVNTENLKNFPNHGWVYTFQRKLNKNVKKP